MKDSDVNNEGVGLCSICLCFKTMGKGSKVSSLPTVPGEDPEKPGLVKSFGQVGSLFRVVGSKKGLPVVFTLEEGPRCWFGQLDGAQKVEENGKGGSLKKINLFFHQLTKGYKSAMLFGS